MCKFSVAAVLSCMHAMHLDPCDNAWFVRATLLTAGEEHQDK